MVAAWIDSGDWRCQALKFLRLQGVEARAANLAYDLVGGHLVHLKLFVGVHHHESFDGMPSLLKNDYHLTRFPEVKRNLFRRMLCVPN